MAGTTVATTACGQPTAANGLLLQSRATKGQEKGKQGRMMRGGT
jgi:hypothetical protein